MRRKSLPEAEPHLNLNLEDETTNVILLLKRMCTFEEAVDFLVSAIPGPTMSDILGELTVWETRPELLRQLRNKIRGIREEPKL